jgi:hypothetical protein
MENKELAQQLIDLFQAAFDAHKQAYIETNGLDPEWPLWYADYLRVSLAKLLKAQFTKSDLVYLIVLADKEQRLCAPGADWTRYYARFFLERYL